VARPVETIVILSDRDIRRAIEAGVIKIEPLEQDWQTRLGSCSIDFRLGNRFGVFNYNSYPYVDARDRASAEAMVRQIEVDDEHPFIMHPGEFVLATTREWLELPDYLLGRIEGRSSLGRLGIIVHGTASIFDPGWIGNPTMELGNLGRLPVALYPGMRICAFTFEELTSPVEVPYHKKAGNKYAGQRRPEASRLAQDDELKQRHEP
jgi:dCTP deaminase